MHVILIITNGFHIRREEVLEDGMDTMIRLYYGKMMETS